MKKITDYSLYLVTSAEYANGRSTYEIVEEAIAGGIDILQMREKHASREELISLGRKLAALCRKNNIIFIVNDDPHLAKAVDADGVHLGQEDMERFPLDETRKIIGEDKLIGVSTHSLEELQRAEKNNCNYIAFGPIFSTLTKDYSIGTENIEKAAATSNKPVIFIGGIDLDNIDLVLERGAKNIASIRAIVQAPDVRSKVKEFKERINMYKPES